MYTIKTLNAISPVGLAKLNNKQLSLIHISEPTRH